MFDDDLDPILEARRELSVAARDGDPEGVRKALAKGIPPFPGGALPGRSQNTPLRLAIENIPFGDQKAEARHQAIDVLLDSYRSHGLSVPAEAFVVAFQQGDLLTTEKLLRLHPQSVENPSPSGGLVTLAINQLLEEKGQARFMRSGGLELLAWALEKGAPADGNDTDRVLGHANPLARALGEVGSVSQVKGVQEAMKKAVGLLASHGATLPWNPERPAWGAMYITTLLKNWPEELAAALIEQSAFSPEEQEQIASSLEGRWASQFRSIAVSQRLPAAASPSVPRPRPRF